MTNGTNSPGFTHLLHSKIDLDRWDQSLQRAHAPLPYAESYYLSAMSPGWAALVSEDYSWLMPLPRNHKLMGFPQVYPPFFMQQLGIFGPEPTRSDVVQNALNAIPWHYLRVRINLNSENAVIEIPGFHMHPRPNYVLPLDASYESISAGYSKSLRKRIRQASERHILDTAPCTPAALIDWYRRHQGHKAGVSAQAYERFQQAMELAIEQGKGFIWGARSQNGVLRVIGFFLCNEQRIINLFGSSDEEGRALYSMHYLLDQVIQQHAGQKRLLDFEGSSIPGVASFFESFGAAKELYMFTSRSFFLL